MKNSWKNVTATITSSQTVDFLSKVRVLVLGRVGSQLLLLLSLPLVTRLFTPYEFGVLQSIESIVQITMVVSALAYERSFVTAGEHVERKRLLFLSIGLSVIFSIGGTILVWTTRGIFSQSELVNSVPPVLLALIIIWIFLGRCLYWVFKAYATSYSLYADESVAEFSRGLGLVVSRILFGFLQFGVIGLLCSSLIGSTIGVTRLIKKTRGYWATGTASCSVLSHLSTAWKYRSYPIYEASGEFSHVVTQYLPIVYLGYYFCLLYTSDAADE